MTAFITKYALTQGILEVEANPILDKRMVCCGVSFALPGFCTQDVFAKDWHETKPASIARAEEMRVAKIASIKKLLAKLEKMKFQ